MTSTNPAEVLFKAYRRQILALLLLHPGDSFYVREISRLTGVPAGSLHRELKVLSDAGLLLRRPTGNQVRYEANRNSPIFEELAGIFRKTVGLADVLREAMVPLSEQIRLAFIFGSVAQGKERITSDIDVLVVGAVEFTRVVQALAQTHQRLRREVNPVVMPPDVFRTKHAEKDRFVTRIIKEPKIFLIGTADDLEKLVEHRTAQTP